MERDAASLHGAMAANTSFHSHAAWHASGAKKNVDTEKDFVWGSINEI